MIETPMIKYRLNRKGFEDRYIMTHTILYELNHIVFIEPSGQVIASFRAEDVISVVRVEGGMVTSTD